MAGKNGTPSRRSEIIAAATELFGQRSIHDLAVSEVAEAIGMTTTGVYYHFPTKEALVLAVVRQIADDISDAAAKMAESREQDPASQLRAAIEAGFAWAREHPLAARLFYVWSVGFSEDVEQIHAEFLNRHIRAALRALRTDKSDDRPQDDREELLAWAMRIMTSMVDDIMTAMLDDDGATDPAEDRAVADAAASLGARLMAIKSVPLAAASAPPQRLGDLATIACPVCGRRVKRLPLPKGSAQRTGLFRCVCGVVIAVPDRSLARDGVDERPPRLPSDEAVLADAVRAHVAGAELSAAALLRTLQWDVQLSGSRGWKRG